MISKSPKLELIQNKLYCLWTNRSARCTYLEAVERNSDDYPLKGIDPKGVKLYSSLIEIGRIDLMSSIYPVIDELLGKQFKTCVLDYFESVPPDHYNLNQSAKRFVDYVQGCSKLMIRYPFLAELADYEWIELAILEAEAAEAVLRQSSLVSSKADIAPEQFAALIPVLNCVFVQRRYLYAIPKLVQAIKEGQKLPRRFKQEPTCVIVYRDPDSLDARFLEVGEVSLMMLETIRQKPTSSYGELIKDACSQNPKNVQAIMTGCLEAIEQFKALKLIVAEK